MSPPAARRRVPPGAAPTDIGELRGEPGERSGGATTLCALQAEPPLTTSRLQLFCSALLATHMNTFGSLVLDLEKHGL